MSRQDYLHLLGEQEQLLRMLAKVPETDVIDRMSLEERLRAVEAALQAVPVDTAEQAHVRLTFRGKPVVGSHGIFADFGATAVAKFIDAVSSVAASFTAPLAATGPIPNRLQNQLLITSTAIGSFGFELEEYRGEQLPLVAGPTPLGLALEQTLALFQGTTGSDDELADSASDTDPRALGTVRSFLETLVNAEATCALEYGARSFRFTDVGQVKRSYERLSTDNLQESTQEIEGEFQGVLPKRRTFEFKLSGQDDVIVGKVGPAIPDADALNKLLRHKTKIKVMITRVGNGRPRYLLLTKPDSAELDSAEYSE